jgi:outer membrane protein
MGSAMHHFLVRSAALLLAVSALSSVARADDVHYNSVRIGSETVFFHPKADDISGPFVPPGANLDVDTVETLYLGYVRRLTTHFDVELAIGIPPKTKTEGKGPATLGSVPYDGQVISTARWISPTLLLRYVFFDDTWKFHPYIGAGVNYSTFYGRKSTPEGDAVSGGPTRISLTASVRPAGTVGMGYEFAPNWGAYASYTISQVKTHLTADTGGVIRTSNISFGPQALTIAIGYSF